MCLGPDQCCVSLCKELPSTNLGSRTLALLCSDLFYHLTSWPCTVTHLHLTFASSWCSQSKSLNYGPVTLSKSMKTNGSTLGLSLSVQQSRVTVAHRNCAGLLRHFSLLTGRKLQPKSLYILSPLGLQPQPLSHKGLGIPYVNGMRQVTSAETPPKINYSNINRHTDCHSREKKSDVTAIPMCSLIYFKNQRVYKKEWFLEFLKRKKTQCS